MGDNFLLTSISNVNNKLFPYHFKSAKSIDNLLHGTSTSMQTVVYAFRRFEMIQNDLGHTRSMSSKKVSSTYQSSNTISQIKCQCLSPSALDSWVVLCYTSYATIYFLQDFREHLFCIFCIVVLFSKVRTYMFQKHMTLCTPAHGILDQLIVNE